MILKSNDTEISPVVSEQKIFKACYVDIQGN